MIELGGIVILGILGQWIAWKMRVPAILPLILMGLGVGPIAEYFLGSKLITPIFEAELNRGLFLSNSFFYFVSMSIGIILFEGGLTLRKEEVKKSGSTILKLITFGSLITFGGGTLAAHYVVGLTWNMSFLFAALIIVTGPTVIAPILRNLPLNKNTSTVLKWEGILIDPIGALVAVLVFEFILIGATGHGGEAFTSVAFGEFSKILVVGTGLGFGGAYLLNYLLINHLVPHYLINVFTLALVLSVFVISDLIAHESGLLTVVVMGMVVGNMGIPHLKDILNFKESMTVLLISVLFITLSANISLSDVELLHPNTFILFLIVLLVLRPLSVFVSTYGGILSFKEKLFISMVGPRGIVAAGIASVFGLKLTEKGIEGANMLTPLVFLIVLGTVLFTALTARFFAKKLKITMDHSTGVTIIGANAGARLIAKFLQENGRHVVLIDNSEIKVQRATDAGLQAFKDNIFDENLPDQFDLLDMGYLLALTENESVNLYACNNLQSTLGEHGCYRLMSPTEMKNTDEPPSSNALFDTTVDFLNFSEAARDFPEIHEIHYEDVDELQMLLKKCSNTHERIPLFIRRKNEQFDVIPANRDDFKVDDGMSLVYLGREITEEELEEEKKVMDEELTQK
ncbi:MAG: sodium:proton antiporter [Chitinophagales bacterium]